MSDTSSNTAPSSPPVKPLPPFSLARMRRQLTVDSVLHILAIILMLAALFALLVLTDGSGPLLSVIPVIMVIVGWMMMNMVSARVSRELPQLTTVIPQKPAQAEQRLAELMRHRPLLRWVRLTLYHRLAMLRHRQQRFAESAAICHAVLAHRMGPAREARPHLLLLLSESALECRDLPTAFAALTELHGMQLRLIESLQRLGLQTRYELAARHDQAALERHEQKMQLAELMPPAQCSAMHAMLATAADRVANPALARSLWARVELLASPDQFKRFQAGNFSVDMSDAMHAFDAPS